MAINFHELPKPAIIAHRGSSAYAPENTIKAFTLAIYHSADAIELDVKLTRDNRVVVFHDQTIQRITNREGWLNKFTLDELKKLDVGSHFDQAFAGECIPTLEEVIEEVGGKILINIELTNYFNPIDALPDIVAKIVKDQKAEEFVFFSSFNPISLIRIQNKLPGIPIALLTQPGLLRFFAHSSLSKLIHYQFLHPYYKDINPNLVMKQHQSGHRVHGYTVNIAEEMQKLFELEIDGIFTDDPILARQVLIKEFSKELME